MPACGRTCGPVMRGVHPHSCKSASAGPHESLGNRGNTDCQAPSAQKQLDQGVGEQWQLRRKPRQRNLRPARKSARRRRPPPRRSTAKKMPMKKVAAKKTSTGAKKAPAKKAASKKIASKKVAAKKSPAKKADCQEGGNEESRREKITGEKSDRQESACEEIVRSQKITGDEENRQRGEKVTGCKEKLDSGEKGCSGCKESIGRKIRRHEENGIQPVHRYLERQRFSGLFSGSADHAQPPGGLAFSDLRQTLTFGIRPAHERLFERAHAMATHRCVTMAFSRRRL